MKLSTKGRYAMVALADLALQEEGTLLSLTDLSKRQNISLPYLEQLFVKLRRAGLVESVRGPGGGYRLAKPCAEIRVADILTAVDETVDAMHTGAGASGVASRRDGIRFSYVKRRPRASLRVLLERVARLRAGLGRRRRRGAVSGL